MDPLLESSTFLVLVIISLASVPVSRPHVISTAQGRIRGEVHDGYVSYKGVPYATLAAPDGRFKRASLAPHWQGIRESREVHCTAASEIEECLQLDVHVPSGTESWPVLVWVAAASGPFHPRTLVQQQIMLVVVYHRIGPSGFLCLGEDKIPGNAGAKDVVLALRWVRDSIVAFNGDAARVVLAGQGIGAAVAEAVMLSPMASGLIHGVILQSGTILAPWTFNYDAKDRAMELGDMVSEDEDIGTTLLKARVEELVDKSNKMDTPYFPFGMCIENAIKHEERLLSEAPFDLLSSRKVSHVPMIIGYNSDEAYIFSSIIKESRVSKTMLKNLLFLLPEELKFLNQREMNQVARQVEDVYFKTNKSLRAILVYHRDVYFVNHLYRSARLHASVSPVYLYQFSYPGDIGVQEEPGVQKTGAAHSDELSYLFSGRQLTDREGTVQMHFVKLWTSFVKYLNPVYGESTRWDTLDPDHPRLLDIRTELNMLEFPLAPITAMWDDIYNKYYYSRNRIAG